MNEKVWKIGRSWVLGTSQSMMVFLLGVNFLLSSTSMTNAACTPTPDCASIGYTETSCETDYLACPFDNTKLKCMPCDSTYRYTCSGNNITKGIGDTCNGKYVSCECNEDLGYLFNNGNCICDTSCSVGNIYYSDGTCSSCIDSLKIAIGIVVKDNELIMSNSTEGVRWGGWGNDIPNLTNVNNINTDFDGINNSGIIVEYFGKDADTMLYAGVFCYKYSTEGTDVGNWYLPAIGELYNYVYTNYNKIQSTWVNRLAWNANLNSKFWSSSEQSTSLVWYINIDSGNLGYHSKNNTYIVSCFYKI